MKIFSQRQISTQKSAKIKRHFITSGFLYRQLNPHGETVNLHFIFTLSLNGLTNSGIIFVTPYYNKI